MMTFEEGKYYFFIDSVSGYSFVIRYGNLQSVMPKVDYTTRSVKDQNGREYNYLFHMENMYEKRQTIVVNNPTLIFQTLNEAEHYLLSSGSELLYGPSVIGNMCLEALS